MRLLLLSLSAALLAACSGRDATCVDLAVQASALAASASSCTADADCRAVYGTTGAPVCGEPSRLFIGEGCAFAVGRDFEEQRYLALRAEFAALGCPSRPIENCGPLPAARCARSADATSGACVIDVETRCDPGAPDAGEPDGGPGDGGVTDAGSADAGEPDAGEADAG